MVESIDLSETLTFSRTYFVNSESQVVEQSSALTRSVNLSGAVDNGILSGLIQIADFTAEISASIVGTNGVNSGYYIGELLGTNLGLLHLFFGPTPSAFSMLKDPQRTIGGLGVVSGTNRSSYQVRLHSGEEISGTLNLSTGSISGEIRNPMDQTTVGHLMGLRHGTLRTDRLKNLSRRGSVSSADTPLIAGFVVGGTERKEILVRAAGPALLDYGLSSALPDPTLTLFSGPDAIAFNDCLLYTSPSPRDRG